MTDESQKGTLMSNTITNGNYYYTQSAYVQNAHYYSNQTIGSGDFQSAVLDKDEETPEISDAVAKEDTPAKKGYTRVITANIWNSGFGATQLADGKTAYSYQGVMQQFQIRIDVDGDTRKYTATGTDENGKEVEMKIYMTFDINQKQYVVVYEEGNEDELYPFIYDDEGNLYPVEDEEEMDMIDEVVSAYEEEN